MNLPYFSLSLLIVHSAYRSIVVVKKYKPVALTINGGVSKVCSTRGAISSYRQADNQNFVLLLSVSAKYLKLIILPNDSFLFPRYS